MRRSGDATRPVLFKTPAAGRKRSLKAYFLSINLKISHGSRRTGTENGFSSVVHLLIRVIHTFKIICENPWFIF